MSYKNLEVKFVGKNLINPFILASAPPTKDYETISNAFDLGWAGAITKSVVLDPVKDKSPRMKYHRQNGEIYALQNYEMGSDLPLDYWVSSSEKLKNNYPDRLLLVSLFGTPDLKEWETLTKAFYDTDIDGFELNFSCPHSDSRGRGYIVGQNLDLCRDITQIVKENSREGIVIMPKLPYISYPNEILIAKECGKVGANAVAGINTIAGLSPINPETLKPKLNTNGKTTAGGFSYNILKPFAYLFTANLSKSCLPISSTGGVTPDKETLASFFAYGANHLQVCTEVMLNRPKVINKFKETLTNYLDEMEITLDELRGSALDKVTTWDKL